VTEQLVGDELPVSEHVVLEKLPLAPPLLNVTVPVGAVGLPELSVTVAVQVVLLPYVTAGHETLVLVECVDVIA
jgi:hypothetical protein